MRNFARMLYLGGAGAAFVLGMGGVAFALSAVPEMDPGTAMSGLALLAGAVMLLREAYRRR
jgi:hypothetical protein